MQAPPYYKNKQRMPIKYIYYLLMLSLVGLNTACDGAPGTRAGDFAPDFKFKNLEDKAIQLSKYRGKVVLVHFWTDWCESCRAEFPRVQAFYEELQSDDFELLAVNVGQPLATSQDFQKSFGITFPMLVDEQAASKTLYKVKAFPTNYFIDPEGKIIRKIVGWVDKQQVKVIINQNKKKQKNTKSS